MIAPPNLVVLESVKRKNKYIYFISDGVKD